MHEALKETAARQGRPISKIIEEGLLLRGVKPSETARQLVERARRHAQYAGEQAVRLAIEETRAVRS